MNCTRSSAVSLKNTRVLALMAMFAAMSILFGKIFAFNITPFIRFSLENLPILMAGMFLGGAAGCLTGVLADVVGCLLVGYSINPIITLGAGCIGLLSGLLFRVLPELKVRFLPDGALRVFFTVMCTHAVGSMLIKSVGLRVFYHFTMAQLVWRVPTYLMIGTVETVIITSLLANKAFAAQIERLNRK